LISNSAIHNIVIIVVGTKDIGTKDIGTKDIGTKDIVKKIKRRESVVYLGQIVEHDISDNSTFLYETSSLPKIADLLRPLDSANPSSKPIPIPVVKPKYIYGYGFYYE
jgi:hypothetical protein